MSDKSTQQSTKDLRDARLAKALQYAPDANATPTPALRDTIKTIAASAISARAAGQLPVKVSWWHALWASTGSARGPWGGALATVVLGCIVTAMWYGQGVPDERVRYSGAAPEAASADVATPASAPSAPTTAASAPSPPQERATTTSPPTKSAAKEAPPAATIAEAPVQAPAPAPVSNTTPNRARSSELAAPQVEQRAAPAAPEALADKAKDQATAEAALARREADASNPVAARPASGAAPMAPAANLAAAPSAPAAAGALLAPSSSADKASSALRLSKVARATVATNWHGASVQYQGRSTQLAAADAQQLQGYVLAVVNSATPQALPGALLTAAPMLRIVFTETDANANPNGAQAMFTLWTGALQWQRTGQPDVVGVPQADALAQLLAQVSALQK